MNNYYKFSKIINDKDSVKYYSSLPTNVLNDILNASFDNIDYYLNYYAEILRATLNSNDYDEHYYLLKSLSEELNDIKIILNILGDNYDK